MSLMTYSRPVRSLVLLGGTTVLAGGAFVVWGLSQAGGVSQQAIGPIVGVAAALLGCYFIFGAWYFATGRASAADVDPQFRPPTFWQRWPISKGGGRRTR
jgi:hypothetical protein